MLRKLIMLLTLGLVAASIAPVFRSALWLMELPAHFRPHTALAAIVIGALGLSSRMPIMATLCAAVMTMQIAFVMLVPRAATSASPGLSIVSQNLNGRNRSSDEIVAMLAREDADLVFLQEYTPEWHSALAEARARYDHAVTEPRPGSFGIAVFSRIDFQQSTVIEFGRTRTPFIVVDIETPEFRGHLINVHFQAPIRRAHAEDRDRQLDELAGLLASVGGAYLIAGDFNNTPSSPSFREFLAATGARLAPPTWLATWPAAIHPLGIPIDLALGSDDVGFGQRGRVEPVGSDHRGFRFTASTAGPADPSR